MFGNTIDGPEVQSGIYDEMKIEAASGLPQLCECGVLAQDCEADHGLEPSDDISQYLPLATLKATNLNFEDLCHWYQRANDLLGQPVTIEKLPDPIFYNRHDFAGDTGTIRPTGPDTFTIDGIKGIWAMVTDRGIVKMSDGEGREYRGFWDYGIAYFSECGCEREDADARIAFAQVMHNI